jgi:hypothetical protein
VSDQCNADIQIGGRLKACCVPALLTALQHDGAGPDYQDPITTPGELDAALERLRAFAVAHRLKPAAPVFGGYVDGGNLDQTEAFCQGRGLPYCQHWDAHYEWTGGNKYWCPGDPPAGQDVSATNENEPVVTLAELRHAWKDKTVAEVLAHYDAICRPVPPLEVVAVAAGGACPGCLAEALAPGSSLPEDSPAAGTPEAA